MEYTFPLIKMPSVKKPSISFALSQYEARMVLIVMISFLLIYFVTDSFEFNALLAPFIVIVIFSLALIIFPIGKPGKVTLSNQSMVCEWVKGKPKERIPLDHITNLSIYTMQKTRFFTFIVLHFVAEHRGTVTEFGVIIKRRKLKKQYLDVLESWYRKGLPVKEFDQLGNRVFKLNYRNYADVQTIKSEYSIEW